jgi:hypothetical protein
VFKVNTAICPRRFSISASSFSIFASCCFSCCVRCIFSTRSDLFVFSSNLIRNGVSAGCGVGSGTFEGIVGVGSSVGGANDASGVVGSFSGSVWLLEGFVLELGDAAAT